MQKRFCLANVRLIVAIMLNQFLPSFNVIEGA
jgi:hypothetical protein